MGKFLDIRPVAEFCPSYETVNIPFSELGERAHELPEKSVPIHLLDIGEEVQKAKLLIESTGREVFLVDPIFAPNPSATYRLWSPNPFVEQLVPKLTPGKALDLGCGAGRDAVYLSSLGWDVNGIDHLPDAVSMANSLSLRYLSAQHKCRFEVADSFEYLRSVSDRFDLILVMFAYHEELLSRLSHIIRGGTYLMLECFTEEHRARFGKPKNSNIANLESLMEAFPDTTVRYYRQDWHENRHTLRVLFES